MEAKAVLRVQREATVRRMARRGGTILAAQDTTSLNYNTHGRTEGIGYISDKTLGVNIHSRLAATTGGPVPGLPDQMSYNRMRAKEDTHGHESKKIRILEEKESFRWAKSLETGNTS